MSALTPSMFDKLVATIRDARPAPRDRVVWGVDVIAGRVDCSAKFIRKLIKTDPEFPVVKRGGRYCCLESVLLAYFSKTDEN